MCVPPCQPSQGATASARCPPTRRAVNQVPTSRTIPYPADFNASPYRVHAVEEDKGRDNKAVKPLRLVAALADRVVGKELIGPCLSVRHGAAVAGLEPDVGKVIEGILIPVYREGHYSGSPATTRRRRSCTLSRSIPSRSSI